VVNIAYVSNNILTIIWIEYKEPNKYTRKSSL
jgi:hypothetical protein